MACTAAEHKMEELYAAIEKKIKASGYPREISGADVFLPCVRLREYLRPILMNKRTIQTRSGRRVCHTKYPVR